MTDERDIRIIQYLESKASAEEIAAIEKWRSHSAENELHFKKVQLIWEKSSLTKPRSNLNIDVDAALSKVHGQIQIPIIESPQKSNIRRRIVKMASAAAVVLICFMAGSWFLQSPDLMIIATSSDQQKEVMLPDGSMVWLNENSELKYPTSFNTNLREIELSGDAVFEVTHNADQAFVVQSDDLSVKVLGTRFNVNTIEENATVYVINGKVQVSNAHQPSDLEIITKGMSVEYNSTKGQLKRTKNFDPNQLYWMNKTLSFNNKPLENVFAVLESQFDVDIEVQNPDLISCIVNGEFIDKTAS